MKNYKSAIDDLSIIIEAKTARATLLEAVHEWRGKAFFMLGEEAKALDDFNQVQLLKKSFTFSRAEEYIRMFSPGDLET
ncbi:MAG: hypothetical protein JNJ61_08665 [Anaerolineae bacterium]|nr:hypothetical protein [Anaerolineae bacterium]